MKFIQYLLLIMLALVSSSLWAETTLTEQSVSKMLKEMDKAVALHDAESLMSHFSDNAKIIFDMPADRGGRKEFGRLEYKSMLKQGWTMPGEHRYEVKDIIITIAADGNNATVTDLIVETIAVEGVIIISSETSEKMTVKLNNNKPMITHLYGKVKS